MKKYFYCVGLHKEGGLNILKRFIIENENYIYILDKRLINKIKIKNSYFIRSSFFSVLNQLIKLKLNLKKDDHLIFVNGLPPILKFRCKVSVMFQNANLFREFYKINILKWIFSKDFLRFVDFRLGLKNVDNWYIFSPISKIILTRYLKSYVNIKIINIFEKYTTLNRDPALKYNYDFIYPASLMSHKNHKLLIEVLIKLSKKNLYPRVLLTLNDNEKKKLNFDYLKNKYNIKLFNFYNNDQKKFLNIYKECKALLFISSNETIGLPIIEAKEYGLFIIAPKLPYSSQFVEPNLSFDFNIKDDLLKCIEIALKINFKPRNQTKKIFNANKYISMDNFFKKII